MTTSAPKHLGLDRFHRRVKSAHAAVEHLVELAQARQRPVDDRHLRAESDGHPGRVRAHDPAAENDHFRRAHARHAAHQHSASARGTAERDRGRFDGEPARDLAHGSEQGQATRRVRHRLVGDRRSAGGHEPARLVGIGSEMEVGEQDLVRLQPAILDGLGLLHFDDHLRIGEDSLGGGHDARARLRIDGVVGEDPVARARLHEHLVAAGHELAHRAWDKPHAELVALDLRRNADAHGCLPACCVMPALTSAACPASRSGGFSPAAARQAKRYKVSA